MLPVRYSLTRRGPSKIYTMVGEGRGRGAWKGRIIGSKDRADEKTAARIKRNKKNSIVKFKVCGLSLEFLPARVYRCADKRVTGYF